MPSFVLEWWRFGAPNGSAFERIIRESGRLERLPKAGEGRSEWPAAIGVEPEAGSLVQVFNSTASPTSQSKVLSVRLPVPEMQRLRIAAGNRSISEYVRARLFSDSPLPAARTRNPVRDHRALGQMLALLGQSRIGENLANLARDAHSGSLLLDDVTRRQIREAHESVLFMRDRLVGALGLIEAR